MSLIGLRVAQVEPPHIQITRRNGISYLETTRLGQIKLGVALQVPYRENARIAFKHVDLSLGI